MHTVSNKRICSTVSLAVIFCLYLLMVLIMNGEVIPNVLFAERYPVKGVDVSSYQGDEKNIDINVFCGTKEGFAGYSK